MSHLGQRIFAAIYDPVLGLFEKRLVVPHRRYVAGGALGDTLEIGAGTGANLPYYPSDIKLTLVEPNPFMLERLQRRLRATGTHAVVQQGVGESLPYDGGAFDTVVTTLTLCSVADPLAAASEIFRVLRPGGRLRFLEHVRSNSAWWARMQDVATPLWKRVSQGCHPNRDTARILKQAGLIAVKSRSFGVGPYPVRPHIAGVAERPGRNS